MLDGRDVWHLIGHLQRNKVRFCRPFALIHSLDSERLARALDEEGAKHDHVFRTLVQVNVSGEASKYGVAPDDVAGAARSCRRPAARRARRGPDDDRAVPRRPRARAAACSLALRELARRMGLRELSMGMSGDFEVAVEEGATLVRIGSALFERRRREARGSQACRPGSTASTST
jgi:PLP dependent protein